MLDPHPPLDIRDAAPRLVGSNSPSASERPGGQTKRLSDAQGGEQDVPPPPVHRRRTIEEPGAPRQPLTDLDDELGDVLPEVYCRVLNSGAAGPCLGLVELEGEAGVTSQQVTRRKQVTAEGFEDLADPATSVEGEHRHKHPTKPAPSKGETAHSLEYGFGHRRPMLRWLSQACRM